VVFGNEGYNGVFIRPGESLVSRAQRHGVLLSPAAQFGARRQRARNHLRDRPNDGDGDGKQEPLHGGGGGGDCDDDGRGLSLEGRGGGVVAAVGGGGSGLAGYHQSQSVIRSNPKHDGGDTHCLKRAWQVGDARGGVARRGGAAAVVLLAVCLLAMQSVFVLQV
jgi:hypothetical protein